MSDALAIDWVGRACPKCGYVRTAADTSPAWQCPRCAIAYAKYVAPPAALAQRLADHGSEMVERAGTDHSLFVLLSANAVALAIAYATRMSIRELLFVYWMQSVVIGATHVIRLLCLRGFATDGFRINGRPVMESSAAKVQVAVFFALHFGIFHFVYLMFILGGRKGGLDVMTGAYALCALAFVVSHAFSLWHNIESDASGRPNIGTLMFLPYARIIPMHAMILSGLAFGHSTPLALLAFGALKTAADAVMHTVEHHLIAKSAPPDKPLA